MSTLTGAPRVPWTTEEDAKLMSGVEYRLLGGCWNRHGDGGPLTLLAFHVDRAPECEHAFAQAQEAQRGRAFELRGPDAAAVVRDREPQALVLRILDPDVHARGVGVPGDIGEKLLEDPEERRRAVLVRVREARRHLDQAAHAGAALEFPRLPVDRGTQADLVQHLRTQARGD